MNQTCSKCGSTKIMRNVPLLDKYGEWGNQSGTLAVKVSGAPDAWLFKDTAVGSLTAHICADCGYTELHTRNHRELYEKYLASQGALPRDSSTAFADEAPVASEESPEPANGADAEPTECLSCGQTIPAGESRCPACGWTWTESAPDA